MSNEARTEQARIQTGKGTPHRSNNDEHGHTRVKHGAVSRKLRVLDRAWGQAQVATEPIYKWHEVVGHQPIPAEQAFARRSDLVVLHRTVLNILAIDPTTQHPVISFFRNKKHVEQSAIDYPVFSLGTE